LKKNDRLVDTTVSIDFVINVNHPFFPRSNILPIKEILNG